MSASAQRRCRACWPAARGAQRGIGLGVKKQEASCVCEAGAYGDKVEQLIQDLLHESHLGVDGGAEMVGRWVGPEVDLPGPLGLERSRQWRKAEHLHQTRRPGVAHVSMTQTTQLKGAKGRGAREGLTSESTAVTLGSLKGK